MKTTLGDAPVPQSGTAAIVHLARVEGEGAETLPAAPAAEAAVDPAQRARAFAEPLLAGQLLDTGEDALAHADGTAAVLRAIGGGPTLAAAAYLVYAGDYLQRPEEVVHKAFGEGYASLVTLTRKLVQIQRAARAAQFGGDAAGGSAAAASAATDPAHKAEQTERVRKMLLAFSRDLRVVLLRLASRLQTLRWYAAARRPCPHALAQESLQVFAPLANRLGIWQIKWELEDLAFRFLMPAEYQRIARLVDETRAERERSVAAARDRLRALLADAGIAADVQGRPKHLYSIWKKMQGKQLGFADVHDVRALRVIVDDVAACYAVLARVHEAWTPLEGEFDDYIARPKANGYQSLHTVVLATGGRPLEVQIRTRRMHEHAEHGVAAHWMYKEAGARGYAGLSGLKPGAAGGAPAGDFEERMAEARKAVLRELLAWERDFSQAGGGDTPAARFDDRIYVFTPQATIIDLPAGGTPVDFAYSVHTDLGHRCRGARVDGRVVPLNTPLQSGQTVEIVTVREGGPSLDWLNSELHYLQSARAKAKVRAWFNAEQQAATIARGREAVEKRLQREGKTALERQALAERLGFKSAEALFEVVGKDEFSLRNIENLLRPAEPAPSDERIALHRPRAEGVGGGRGGVLVVGMDSLLTTLARCCRPAPPDAIRGFVTRGRGVAVHRRDCANLREMARSAPGRVIEVAWGTPQGERQPVYPLDVTIEASDRPGLLRDISEAFAKEKMNVIGAATQTARDRGLARLALTVEVSDAARLGAVLAQIERIAGVRHARRK
jgi:GTP pyrophosphokinase